MEGLIFSEDPQGRRTTRVYDMAGQRVAVADPLGNRTTAVYNAAGRVIARANALSNRVTKGLCSNNGHTAPIGELTIRLHVALAFLVDVCLVGQYNSRMEFFGWTPGCSVCLHGRSRNQDRERRTDK
jgi:YD repeat-containing protein